MDTAMERRRARPRVAGAHGLCVLALVGGQILLAAQGRPGPSQEEVSRELARLVADDQKDQNDPSWNESTDAEFSRRQGIRRDRVMEIVEAEMLDGVEDWGNAALLLQHGQSSDDYLLAHVLSLPPAAEDAPFSRFLCAATLDRFLHSVGRAQIFTTQSGAPTPDVYSPVEPFDDSMSQALRERFRLPPLPKTERAATPPKVAKRPSAKELPKLLKRAEKDPVPGAEEAPEWLLRAREIVRDGALESAKDFDLAAQVLARGTEAEDLLSAHVLAMCAAFEARKDDGAKLLCAETLDRFLASIRQPQRFDTLRDGDAPREPRRPLPEFIRREYGSTKRDR